MHFLFCRLSPFSNTGLCVFLRSFTLRLIFFFTLSLLVPVLAVILHQVNKTFLAFHSSINLFFNIGGRSWLSQLASAKCPLVGSTASSTSACARLIMAGPEVNAFLQSSCGGIGLECNSREGRLSEAGNRKSEVNNGCSLSPGFCSDICTIV